MHKSIIAELYIGNLKRYYKRVKTEVVYPIYKEIIITANPSCPIMTEDGEKHIFNATGNMFVFEKYKEPIEFKTRIIQKYILTEIER